MYPGTYARKHPDRPAIIMTGSGEVVTYAQLEDRSLRVAHWLREAGLRRGDVVGLISDNSAWIFDVYWATQRSGLYYVPINYRLNASEIEYMLDNSGAAALFVGKGGLQVAKTLESMRSSCGVSAWRAKLRATIPTRKF
jgi:long-chain acyl-CoA synthetase